MFIIVVIMNKPVVWSVIIFKRVAAKKLRGHCGLLQGGLYKKVFETYNITDYCFPLKNPKSKRELSK